MFTLWWSRFAFAHRLDWEGAQRRISKARKDQFIPVALRSVAEAHVLNAKYHEGANERRAARKLPPTLING